MGHFGSKSGVQVVYENSSVELSGTLSREGKKEASVLGVLPCKLNNVMSGDRSPLSFLVVGYSYGVNHSISQSSLDETSSSISESTWLTDTSSRHTLLSGAESLFQGNRTINSRASEIEGSLLCSLRFG